MSVSMRERARRALGVEEKRSRRDAILSAAADEFSAHGCRNDGGAS